VSKHQENSSHRVYTYKYIQSTLAIHTNHWNSEHTDRRCSCTFRWQRLMLSWRSLRTCWSRRSFSCSAGRLAVAC